MCEHACMTEQTCTIIYAISGECGKPAVATSTVGCVHEHLEELLLCAGHAAPSSPFFHLTYACDPCSSGPERHDCIGRFSEPVPLPNRVD